MKMRSFTMSSTGKICEAFIANLCNELRRDFEDLHLDEALKWFFVETHLTDLSHKFSIDFEDARLDQFFHAEVFKAAGFHLAHELRIDLEDRGFEKIADTEFTETLRRRDRRRARS